MHFATSPLTSGERTNRSLPVSTVELGQVEGLLFPRIYSASPVSTTLVTDIGKLCPGVGWSRGCFYGCSGGVPRPSGDYLVWARQECSRIYPHCFPPHSSKGARPGSRKVGVGEARSPASAPILCVPWGWGWSLAQVTLTGKPWPQKGVSVPACLLPGL